MLQKQRATCATLYLVAAVFLAFERTPTEAFHLKKVPGPNGRGEASETVNPYGEGVIVFGKGLKKSSVDGYQADFPGWYQGNAMGVNPHKSLWNQMSKSLMCGRNQMTFSAVGSAANHFYMNQDPLLPLSHVPSSCGYNMHQNPYGLVMDVPYHGCYIVQQDDCYNLILIWNGIPVSLTCPILNVTPTTTPTTTLTTTTPTTTLSSTVTFPWCPLWLPFCSTTNVPTSTTAAPEDPSQSQKDYYYWLLQQQQQQQQSQSTTPSPQAPKIPQHLYHYYLHYLHHMLHQQGQSATTAPPQTAVPDFPAWYRWFQQQ